MAFSLNTLESDRSVVIEIKGYFDGVAGQSLDAAVDALARKGKTGVILDFGPCDIINSMGVAALLDILLKVTEDFKGKVVFCGLDTLKRNVFKIAGLFSVAPEAPDRAQAEKLVSA